MAITQTIEAPAADQDIPVRRIEHGELRKVLDEGWRDFLHRRGDLLFVGLIYPAVGLIAAAVSLGGSLIPLFFPIAAGIALLGPVAAVGFYELARRRELGHVSTWHHFLDVRKRPAWDSIMAVSGILLTIFLAWLLTAAALYAAFLGAPPANIGEFLTRLFTTSEGWMLILVGNLVGLGFAIVVLALSVVSLPMLVDCDVGARTALRTSVRAVRANKGAMARWGLIVAVLLVLGSIPVFVGLAFVLPWLGYSTWHLYTRLVDRGALPQAVRAKA